MKIIIFIFTKGTSTNKVLMLFSSCRKDRIPGTNSCTSRYKKKYVGSYLKVSCIVNYYAMVLSTGSVWGYVELPFNAYSLISPSTEIAIGTEIGWPTSRSFNVKSFFSCQDDMQNRHPWKEIIIKRFFFIFDIIQFSFMYWDSTDSYVSNSFWAHYFTVLLFGILPVRVALSCGVVPRALFVSWLVALPPACPLSLLYACS